MPDLAVGDSKIDRMVSNHVEKGTSLNGSIVDQIVYYAVHVCLYVCG